MTVYDAMYCMMLCSFCLLETRVDILEHFMFSILYELYVSRICGLHVSPYSHLLLAFSLHQAPLPASAVICTNDSRDRARLAERPAETRYQGTATASRRIGSCGRKKTCSRDVKTWTIVHSAADSVGRYLCV